MKKLKDYVTASVKGCAALTDDQISAAIGTGDKKTLYAYAQRVAALGAVWCQRSAPEIDDDDWLDAAQECLINFEEILAKWEPVRGPLFQFLTVHFRVVMVKYVRELANGGMGGSKSGAQFTVSLDALQYTDIPDETGFSDDFEHHENLTNDSDAPFGMRDPLIESMAYERVRSALRDVKQSQRRRFSRRMAAELKNK